MHSDARTQMLRLAGAQHGVISRRQLREQGFTGHQIAHLQASGRLRAVSRGVFLVEGSPATWRQAAYAAVADAGPGAALSHHAAAALWGLPGFPEAGLHVIVRRGVIDHRSPLLATVHTSRQLPSHHIVELDGIQVTSPVRTVFDLSGVLPLGRLARTLDDAWGLRLLRADALYDALEELRGRGRGRVGWMRMLIEERGSGYAAPESGLERRFRRLLDQTGQAPMEYQVDLGGEGWVARVDAVDRRARLVVQIDSARHHSALLDRRHDDEQDAALRALGWTVLRITEDDLRRRPAWVMARVRAARTGAVDRRSA